MSCQEEFAGDEADLDGFAETDIVGDEEVDARQAQGLAQGFHLVGVDLDAGAEGAWMRLGSVAVTQLQRWLWKKAAKWRGASKPRVSRRIRDIHPS